MNKIYACIDGLASTPAVIDAAIWAAQRLNAPLAFLHALERHPEHATASDHSGAIGLGAQESLLLELSTLDAQRSQRAQEAARQLLARACEQATVAGILQLTTRLRHGELADTLLEAEPDARLLVLGEHYHASRPQKIHLDHHVERVIRAVKRPVLVIPRAPFQVPQRVVIAFDGSPTARQALETVARSPMLAGLPVLVAMAGADTPQARSQLEEARQVLATADFETGIELSPGAPEHVLPALLKAQGAALLVMGAYGHSRIRQLIVGSTTSTLLRLSDVPVLILR